jgi:hypothetical protein
MDCLRLSLKEEGIERVAAENKSSLSKASSGVRCFYRWPKRRLYLRSLTEVRMP